MLSVVQRECGFVIRLVSGPWGSRATDHSCQFPGGWGPHSRCYWHWKSEAMANGGLPVADLTRSSCERVLRSAEPYLAEQWATIQGVRWLTDLALEELDDPHRNGVPRVRYVKEA